MESFLLWSVAMPELAPHTSRHSFLSVGAVIDDMLGVELAVEASAIPFARPSTVGFSQLLSDWFISRGGHITKLSSGGRWKGGSKRREPGYC